MEGSDKDRSNREHHLGGEAWARFNQEFEDLLRSESSTGLAVFAFVRRNLVQFRLINCHSEFYVLSEVYVRAHHTIVDREEPISNCHAWIRKTAYNVIRELKRKQQRWTFLEEDTLDRLDFDRSSIEALLEHDLQLLREALQLLNAEDRRLIELKIIQDLSWREIQSILQQEEIEIDLNTLRKRKERAMTRLRRLYHLLSQEDAS